MNYETLATELTTDPLSRGYSGMSDSEAAASLNASDRAKRQLVPLWQLKKTLIESQEWPAIVGGQASETPAVAGLCLAIVEYVNDQRFQNLDMDLASTKAMIAGAVSAGLVAQATADALDDLADYTVSRAEELGLPVVLDSDVGIARGTRPLVQGA